MENRQWEVSTAPEGIQGKTIQDFLYFEGMYNPVLRFAFTNALDVDFKSKWNSVPYVVKAHDTVKVPHHLAKKFTVEIVDIMMNRDNKQLLMAVPAARKEYEDKVLALLPPENSSELEIIKGQFLEQLQRDASRPEGQVDEQSPASNLTMDFEDLRKKDFGGASHALAQNPESLPKAKGGKPKKS